MTGTTKYLLLVRVDEELAAGVEDTGPEAWIAAAGTRRLEGHQLRGPGDATLVRDAGALVTDGPFAETKEEIAGYDVIDWDGDLGELVELAARHPVVRFGAIEIRPILTHPPTDPHRAHLPPTDPHSG